MKLRLLLISSGIALSFASGLNAVDFSSDSSDFGKQRLPRVMRTVPVPPTVQRLDKEDERPIESTVKGAKKDRKLADTRKGETAQQKKEEEKVAWTVTGSLKPKKSVVKQPKKAEEFEYSESSEEPAPKSKKIIKSRKDADKRELSLKNESLDNSSMLSTESSRDRMKEVSRLRRDLDSANSEIEGLRREILIRKAECEKLKARAKDSEESLASVKAELKAAKSDKELDKLRKNLEGRRLEIADLNGKIEELQDQLEEKEQARQAAVLKSGDLREQIEQLEAEPARIQAEADEQVAELSRELRGVKEDLGATKNNFRGTHNLAVLASTVAGFPRMASLATALGRDDWEVFAGIIDDDTKFIKQFIEGYEPGLLVKGFETPDVENSEWSGAIFKLYREIYGADGSVRPADCIAKAKSLAYRMNELLAREGSEQKRNFITGRYFPVVKQLVVLGVASKIKQEDDDALEERVKGNPDMTQEELLESFEEVVNTSLGALNDIPSMLQASEKEEEEEEEEASEKVQPNKGEEEEKAGESEAKVEEESGGEEAYSDGRGSQASGNEEEDRHEATEESVSLSGSGDEDKKSEKGSEKKDAGKTKKPAGNPDHDADSLASGE